MGDAHLQEFPVSDTKPIALDFYRLPTDRSPLFSVEQMMNFLRTSLFLLLFLVVSSGPSAAEPLELPGVNPEFLRESYLQDRNGNGELDIIAFGDSLTRGVGDFTAANERVFSVDPPSEGEDAGFPRRLEGYFGVPISNGGKSGERAVGAGLRRFASLIPAARPDIVVISEGSNDAQDQTPRGEVSRTLQTMINIAHAVGSTPVLWSIPSACCGRIFLVPYTTAYNDEIAKLAMMNEVPFANVSLAYRSICGGIDCYLLNRPEGLHPNIEGYDVIAEMIAAALLNVDLLAPGGAEELEAALRLPPGSVRTKPKAVPAK